MFMFALEFLSIVLTGINKNRHRWMLLGPLRNSLHSLRPDVEILVVYMGVRGYAFFSLSWQLAESLGSGYRLIQTSSKSMTSSC